MDKRLDPKLQIDNILSRNVAQAAETKRPFPRSLTQQQVIKSDAPAILLKSGPGTGKTHALAARVRYLLVSKKVSPSNIVILSFSSSDASHLKRKSLDLIYAKNDTYNNPTRNQLSERLWSGTIHAFSRQILRSIGQLTKNKRRGSFRVITDRERRLRMDKSLTQLLTPVRCSPELLKRRQLLVCEALKDTRQSRGLLLHYMKRCLELWKEANLLVPPSKVIDIDTMKFAKRNKANLEACLEVALRLGVPATAARLAWEVAPIYQQLHIEENTCDPSDLAPLAFHALLANPDRLNTIRSRLHTIILDEYQDISVSQHALVRLLVRGIVPASTDHDVAADRGIPPVLLPNRRNAKKDLDPSSAPPLRVPSLFCGGDEDQSIYGWRGAAPSLSVDGFRSDYPQGLVVPLDTSFRLSKDMWETVSLLGSRIAAKAHTEPNSPVATQNSNDSLVSIMCSGQEELTSTVLIKGLRDAREEAKFIATRIRGRSRDRLQRFKKSMKLMGLSSNETSMLDPTEVAVFVRSEPEKEFIKEELNLKGIPFVDNEAAGPESKTATLAVGAGVPMEPVVLMTMHRAKGFEFDEVYLKGFNEGVFPHPTAVSTNRVDEERRLAFVAISRARQHVTITHSFFRVGVQYGNPSDPIANKRVTIPVTPSRFLYELVPDARGSTRKKVTNPKISRTGSRLEQSQLPSIVWQREPGAKDQMVGMKDEWKKIPNGYALVDDMKAESWSGSKRKLSRLVKATEDLFRLESGA